VVLSDLTYIKCNSTFLYICFLTDLFNREIVGYSVTEKHDTDCVIEAFINWYNNYIIHESNGYKTPADVKNLSNIQQCLKITRHFNCNGPITLY
jgi:transposase InsO family protein